MKCIARITEAKGDWEGSVPGPLLDCAKKWNKEQSEKVGKSILDEISKYLKAHFLPISIPELSEYLESDSDIEAIEILPFSFDFDDNNEPSVGVYAVFDIPFKENFKPEMVQTWKSEDGDSLTWCVSFSWEIDGREVYLDIDYTDISISTITSRQKPVRSKSAEKITKKK